MIWGKVIGAIFGYLFLLPFGLGPLGAVLGIFIGHTVDRQLVIKWRGSHTTQSIFFSATFSVMGHIAKADGRVSEDDIRAAKKIMRRLNLSEAQRQMAIQYFKQGKQAGFNLEQTLLTLRQACHNHRLLLHLFIEIQTQAAQAEGRTHQAQQHILNQIYQTLGFSQPSYQYTSGASQQRASSSYQQQAQRSSYQSSLAADYALLNIHENASNAEVKRAYRKQMSQHHPDKLIAQGLPEEMLKIATEKTQRIQAAYERIKTARNL